MLISDCSSDVCSSDLLDAALDGRPRLDRPVPFFEIRIVLEPLPLPFMTAQPGKCRDIGDAVFRAAEPRALRQPFVDYPMKACRLLDRKGVGWGKSVSVRVDLGGSRLIKKKKNI